MWLLTAMSYGVIALIALQLFLWFEHYRIAEFLVGLVLLAVFGSIFLWIRRSGLLEDIRGRRRAG